LAVIPNQAVAIVKCLARHLRSSSTPKWLVWNSAAHGLNSPRE
jgi:hypothetical protein